VLFCAVLTVLSATGFVLLAAGVASYAVAPGWDQDLLTLLAVARTPALTIAFRVITLAGAGLVVTAISIACVVLLLAVRRRAYALLFAVAMSAGWLVESIVKNVVHRGRPPASDALIALPSSFSFPSGHAFVSLVLCGLLVFIGSRQIRGLLPRLALGIAAAVLVVLVGMSRVYLGVHWPSDILASWCLAVAWLSLCLGCFTVWRSRHPTPEAERAAKPTEGLEGAG
jgi:membrane-associated phospholipid phosphatase